MNFKGNYMNPALLVAGIILGVIGHNWASTMNKGMSAPNKDKNDVRIEQNAKCLAADMEPVLKDGEIMCSQNEGYESIKNYFAKKQAAHLIAKSEDKQPPKKDPKWPENPDSFETKSKRTE
jgi:hypothetical protein